jgi:RimJ/RimL family protein N-acetyltransferase
VTRTTTDRQAFNPLDARGGATWFARAVVLRETDPYRRCRPLRIIAPRDRQAEIGYGLARTYRGRATATEAAGLILPSASRRSAWSASSAC